MRLTTDQVEAKMTAAWGRQTFIVAHRISGNRYTYMVTDHEEHWQPLQRSWERGRAVFEPVAARWPEDPWADAILEAVEPARTAWQPWFSTDEPSACADGSFL